MCHSEEEFQKLVDQLNIEAKPNSVTRERLRRDVLETFDAASEAPGDYASITAYRSPRLTIRERIITMKNISKIAAMFILAAGLVGLWAVLNPGNGAGGSAYAEIARQLRVARTLTFRIVVSSHLPQVPEQSMEIAFKEPGLMRFAAGNEAVSIVDQSQKRGILITHGDKHYSEMDLTENPPQKNQVDMIEYLRTLPDRADEELGEKMIEGRSVRGFLVREDALIKNVWIEPATGDLIRVDIEYLNDPEARAVATNFKFNVDLNDSLFSLTPPAGYTPTKAPLNLTEFNEQDLIDFLQHWADHLGNDAFPPTLNPTQLAQETLKLVKSNKLSQIKPLSEDELKQQSWKITRAMMFVMQMKKENDWHYAGDDVKLGETDRAIFWYRPNESATYRVIYGDLSIKNLPADQLPSFSDH